MRRNLRAMLVGLLLAAYTFPSVSTAQTNLTTYVYKSATSISNGGNTPEFFWGMPNGYLTMQRQFDNILSLLYTVDGTTGFYAVKPNENVPIPISLVSADVDLRRQSFFGGGLPGFGLAWLLCNPPQVLTVNVMHTFPSGCPIPADAGPPSIDDYALWHSTWSTPDGTQVTAFNDITVHLFSVSVAPEPSTTVLLGIGLAVIAVVSFAARRRRTRAPVVAILP